MHIKKNEQGITLVEVLATIILLSMVSILLFNILAQGQKTYVKSTENIHLEQEAQLIIETIRKKHFLSDTYTILVQDKLLKFDNVIVSEGYDYSIKINSDDAIPKNGSLEVNPSRSKIVDITLSKDGQQYNVRTVLEKWQ